MAHKIKNERVLSEEELKDCEAYKKRIKKVIEDNGNRLKFVTTGYGTLDKKQTKLFEVLYIENHDGELSIRYLHAPGLFRNGCPIKYDERTELFMEGVIGASRPQCIADTISYWLYGKGEMIKNY